MRCGEHEMTLRIDVLRLLLSFAPPKKEDHMISTTIHPIDDSIGELLPAFAKVRTWFAFAHGEGAVEQKHSLLSPMTQTAISGEGLLQIIRHFLKDIAQRRRDSHS